jgi:hypothetical protein
MVSQRINKMIDQQIKKSNNELNNILNMMPEFILAVDKFRAGDRNALEFLDSIITHSQDTMKINLALKIIQEKRNDYITAYIDTKKERIMEYLDLDPKKDTICSVIEPKLKLIIKNDKDLNKIYFATKLLTECTGEEIIPFDMKYIHSIE